MAGGIFVGGFGSGLLAEASARSGRSGADGAELVQPDVVADIAA